jgi:hypothetical protein
LTRTLKRGCVGADVEGWTRGAHRFLHTGQLKAYSEQKEIVRRTFGQAKIQLAKRCARELELPMFGVVGPALYKGMEEAGAFDAKSEALFDAYEESLRPKLVEPRQGFDSLHPSLWQAFSLGRGRYGLSDLGTYNPASRLPSGRPSDHAVYPAFAFDLGIEPDTGWNNLKGKLFFLQVRFDPAVEYVILGDKIWSRGSLHAYYSGGHMNHVHVSGRR